MVTLFILVMSSVDASEQSMLCSPPSPPAYTPQTTVVVCCPLISDPVLRASVCAIFVNVWFGASPVNCLIDRQTVLIIAAFIVTAELS